jgi:hypothetical protein
MRFLLALPLALAFTACVRDDGDDTADTDVAGPAADGTVPLGDANNFSYDGTLDAPSFPMAELTDATLDWSALHTDIQCHALDPVADIDNTALIVFPYLSEEEVETGLSDGSLAQVDMGVYLSYQPGDTTSVSLTQLTFFGTDADIETHFTEGSGAWLLLLTTGTEVAVGARMLTFLTPTVGETTTTASVDDGCPVLDFHADLASLQPVPVLADGPWKLDWSGLTRDGHGGEFVPTRVDSVMVARFDLSVPELQDRFLDLEDLAVESYTYDLGGGTSADLGALAGPSDPFPGFSGDGVWAVALLCSTCSNPAPLFLTIVTSS